MGDKLFLGMLQAAQKAAKIAQLCRAEKSLFEILIQEKGRLKSDALDFKTLADVFIQQVAISELDKEVPGIGQRVFGEESNQFTNKLGETIGVQIKDSVGETAALLSKVFDGNFETSRLMAEAGHSTCKVCCDAFMKGALDEISKYEIDTEQIGIWIDPIDGTSQYVKGVEKDNQDKNNVYECGLQCVTVLIGAYDIKSGLPVAGVVNQPFYKRDSSNNWIDRCIWGVCYNNKRISNIQQLNTSKETRRQTHKLIVASQHDEEIKSLVTKVPDLTLCTAGGAGYKCLCVVEGLVDAWVYSDDCCYKWDTCATQALLMCLGGSVVSLKKATECSEVSTEENILENLKSYQLKYNMENAQPAAPWANIGGTIAYTANPKSLDCVKSVLNAISQANK